MNTHDDTNERTAGRYTVAQFESLGRLITLICHRGAFLSQRIYVQPEIAGNAMLVVVDSSSGEAPQRIVYGIEPDGYTHT